MPGLLLYCSLAQAQKLSPEVIPSAGGIAKASEIQLEWTLGENSIETVAGKKGKFTQGFHQPTLAVSKNAGFVTPVIDYDLNVIVAPNPVQSVLSVQVLSGKEHVMQACLTDFTGKLLARKNLSTPIETTFNLDHFAAGVYFLMITNDKGLIIGNYKILKSN